MKKYENLIYTVLTSKYIATLIVNQSATTFFLCLFTTDSKIPIHLLQIKAIHHLFISPISSAKIETRLNNSRYSDTAIRKTGRLYRKRIRH